MMDLLSKLSLKDVVNSSSAVPIYFKLVQRFVYDRDAEVQVQSFVQKCVETMSDLELQANTIKSPASQHKVNQKIRYSSSRHSN